MVKRKLRLDWSALLLGEAPCGLLCIQKSGKDYWEFPGGKRHANDRKPDVTAVRETREETGLRLGIGDVTLIGNSEQFNHFSHRPFQMYVYHARLTDAQIASHKALSKEGEKVGIFTWAQLNDLGEHFSPFHRSLAQRYGVWKTK
jgi:8-oxo-dGTP pyrophosphatase MutT (NUDIX family)